MQIQHSLSTNAFKMPAAPHWLPQMSNPPLWQACTSRVVLSQLTTEPAGATCSGLGQKFVHTGQKTEITKD